MTEDSPLSKSEFSGPRPSPERPLKVWEIFHSIQGESTHSGRPCVLVRLTGCQMRCRWCDTEYAFSGGRWMEIDEIVEAVRGFDCRLVELTGGEPLLQPGSDRLLTRLCDEGYEVLLETGGGLDARGVDPRVRRILDVKCPGSGEAENNFWPNLDDLRPGDEVKMVLADRTDYEWARELVRERRVASRCPVHFSPVHGEIEPRILAEWILEDRLPVRIQLQLHKLLWGAEVPGV
ncbi:MAG: 7-carboxy-7-deazaguanine synthase QueE [Thermoanaerobaculia bacterium]|nr:7-carboxy-7-deazaguanine synthase QueE [Thermoanaerobaculia bacterium]